jgi:hypothetical protein
LFSKDWGAARGEIARRCCSHARGVDRVGDARRDRGSGHRGGAAGRAAVGVVLAALYCVPAWWDSAASGGRAARAIGRSLVVVGAFSWSLAWYLLVARHYGLPGLGLITT